MNNLRRATLAAIALAGLAVPSQAVEVSITLTVREDLDNALFLFQDQEDSSNAGVVPVGEIEAGVYGEKYDVEEEDNLAEFLNYKYTLLATYEDGIVVAMDNDDALDAVGEDFEEVFTGFDEDDLVSALETYDTSLTSALYVANFFQNNTDKFPLTGSSTLVAFTGGEIVGEMHVAAVPEPATMAALSIGALALLRRRKTP